MRSFFMENDVDALIAKVQQSVQATERVRRSKMTREALLEEYAQKNKCTCESDGRCYRLMKELLDKNGLDDRLQREVLGALRTGRAKMRNICLIGGPDSGKSFLIKGLKLIFGLTSAQTVALTN